MECKKYINSYAIYIRLEKQAKLYFFENSYFICLLNSLIHFFIHSPIQQISIECLTLEHCGLSIEDPQHCEQDRWPMKL